MTNKQFIINDLETGDFLDYEVKAILKELNKAKNKSFANHEYSGYAVVQEFYDNVVEKL